jgi:single-strand DNA-binding protein
MASRSWNRVELIGNLTRDPELRYTPNGAAVASFGIATNRTYVTDEGKREEVDFHKIVAWNKLAELCSQLLKKGSKVFISGRLQYREWETQEGQKRRDAEIVLEDMIVLTPKGDGGEDHVVSEETRESRPKDDQSLAGEEQKIEKPEELKAEAPEAPTVPQAEAPEEKPKVNEVVSDEDLPF